MVNPMLIRTLLKGVYKLLKKRGKIPPPGTYNLTEKGVVIGKGAKKTSEGIQGGRLIRKNIISKKMEDKVKLYLQDELKMPKGYKHGGRGPGSEFAKGLKGALDKISNYNKKVFKTLKTIQEKKIIKPTEHKKGGLIRKYSIGGFVSNKPKGVGLAKRGWGAVSR